MATFEYQEARALDMAKAIKQQRAWKRHSSVYKHIQTLTCTYTHRLQEAEIWDNCALHQSSAPSELGQPNMLLPWTPLPKALETLTYSSWLCLRNNRAGGGRPGDEPSAVCKHGGRSHCNGEAGQAPFKSGHKGYFRISKGGCDAYHYKQETYKELLSLRGDTSNNFNLTLNNS